MNWLKLVVNIIRKHLKNDKNISGNQTQFEINRDHITTTPWKHYFQRTDPHWYLLGLLPRKQTRRAEKIIASIYPKTNNHHRNGLGHQLHGKILPKCLSIFHRRTQRYTYLLSILRYMSSVIMVGCYVLQRSYITEGGICWTLNITYVLYFCPNCFLDMLEVVGNDDTGVSIVYTDSNGRPIQNQSLPGLTTVTISEVKPNINVVITIVL